jgi:hypothetical protein
VVLEALPQATAPLLPAWLDLLERVLALPAAVAPLHLVNLLDVAEAPLLAALDRLTVLAGTDDASDAHVLACGVLQRLLFREDFSAVLAAPLEALVHAAPSLQSAVAASRSLRVLLRFVWPVPHSEPFRWPIGMEVLRALLGRSGVPSPLPSLVALACGLLSSLVEGDGEQIRVGALAVRSAGRLSDAGRLSVADAGVAWAEWHRLQLSDEAPLRSLGAGLAAVLCAALVVWQLGQYPDMDEHTVRKALFWDESDS